MADKAALIVIDTQRGMFETPGVPPVAARVIPSGEVPFGEPVRA